MLCIIVISIVKVSVSKMRIAICSGVLEVDVCNYNITLLFKYYCNPVCYILMLNKDTSYCIIVNDVHLYESNIASTNENSVQDMC